MTTPTACLSASDEDAGVVDSVILKVDGRPLSFHVVPHQAAKDPDFDMADIAIRVFVFVIFLWGVFSIAALVGRWLMQSALSAIWGL